jgi:hypothetical protein
MEQAAAGIKHYVCTRPGCMSPAWLVHSQLTARVTTTDEYRVVWKNEAGNEDWITLNEDYRPLTEQQARDFAEGRLRHSDYFKNTDIRVQVRRVIVTGWRDL